MTLEITRPPASELPPAFRGYLEEAPSGNVLTALEEGLASMVALLERFGDSRGGHRYAPGKWSVKEVANHLIDAERVFVYRALRFARGDATPLAGFDENAYAPEAAADARPMADLVQELTALRRSDLAFFRGLNAAAWERKGLSSQAELSVRAVPYIIAGHERHHLRILRERYGTPASS